MVKVVIAAAMALVLVIAGPALAGQNDSCQGGSDRHLRADQIVKLQKLGIPRGQWDTAAALALIKG